MKDPWKHPELYPLLRAANRAKQMITDNPAAASDIQITLDDIHQELGKRLHLLTPEEVDLDGPEPLQTLHGTLRNFDTSEPETLELVLDVDTDSDSYITPIPESTPLPEDLEALRKRRLPPPVSRPHSSQIPSLPEGDVAPWKRAVVQAMHLLESPKVLHAYTDLSTENARLLWASRSVDGYLARIPPHLSGPLLNLLAARCHHLSGQIELQWGTETTLKRLNRAARNQNLGSMAAFAEPPQPEYQSWFEDAQHWWDVLAHGMRLQLS